MNRRKTREAILYNGRLVKLDDKSRAVDPDKFMAWMKRRGLKQVEICDKLGYLSDSTISHALRAGVFSGLIVQGLLSNYGLRPEEYEYNPPEIKPAISAEQEATLEVPLEESTLYVTMKTAILDALKEWWGGGYK